MQFGAFIDHLRPLMHLVHLVQFYSKDLIFGYIAHMHLMQISCRWVHLLIADTPLVQMSGAHGAFGALLSVFLQT